jgi:hypothetical protein
MFGMFVVCGSLGEAKRAESTAGVPAKCCSLRNTEQPVIQPMGRSSNLRQKNTSDILELEVKIISKKGVGLTMPNLKDNGRCTA